MNPREQVANGLATAMLGGAWSREPMRARIARALGRPRAPRWAGALVGQVLGAYRDAPADRPRELAAYVQTTPAWQLAWEHRRPPRIVRWAPTPTVMVARPWPVIELDDLGALARLLAIDQGELAWFADVRSIERRSGQPLRHYRWRALPKRGGVRLVAAPKPRLKEIQRRLLRHVLTQIPVHPAAHGCVPGRSVRTAVDPHAGAAIVIRADVEGFFSSISAGRIWGLLRMAGLPEPVAHTITGLVTTVVPTQVWRAVPRPTGALLLDAHLRMGERLATPHLPQGAPTSPVLANLAAFSLDRRLTGLAGAFGGQYTRYVDDLTFSGGPSLRNARSRFVELVDDIVRSDRLRLNERKTVVLGAAGRQQLLGAVINDHPTVARHERDALRALLHNCATRGWQTQTRGLEADEFRATLLGRISWIGGLDPSFGARLRRSFDAVDWS
ncbi:MAG: RNA-directed DNA polymerase [Pseudonocardiales bacterium]|nr:MAG: RNA-directed DNA polymerase [Pseudonocardiales bacterium]